MPSKLFLERVGKIPEEVKRLNRLSMRIAYKIGKFLDEKPMTQRKLAELMNKKDSEISRWLSGKHNFTLETIAKIETTLKIQLLEVPMEVPAEAKPIKAENMVTAPINLNAEKNNNLWAIKVNTLNILFPDIQKNFAKAHNDQNFFIVEINKKNSIVDKEVHSEINKKDSVVDYEALKWHLTKASETYDYIPSEKDKFYPVKSNIIHWGAQFRTSSTSTCSLTR